jgi:hypothetical protein
MSGIHRPPSESRSISLSSARIVLPSRSAGPGVVRPFRSARAKPSKSSCGAVRHVILHSLPSYLAFLPALPSRCCVLCLPAWQPKPRASIRVRAGGGVRWHLYAGDEPPARGYNLHSPHTEWVKRSFKKKGVWNGKGAAKACVEIRFTRSSSSSSAAMVAVLPLPMLGLTWACDAVALLFCSAGH